MTLVDSSVRIDYFRGTPTPEAERLDQLLGTEPLLMGDLILCEVLQGFDSATDFDTAKGLFDGFEIVPLGGADVCLQAARNFRALRRPGITAQDHRYDHRDVLHQARLRAALQRPRLRSFRRASRHALCPADTVTCCGTRSSRRVTSRR